MRVLVTGASGFVGRAIVTELLGENHEVFCLVRQKSENLDELPNVWRGEISDAESLSPLENVKNIDVIIHAAGLAHQFGKTSDDVFGNVNVTGTENIANLAVKLKIKHFVLISSVSVYGDVKNKSNLTELIDENFSCKPQGIYARSKFEGEKIATEICEKNKIALTILRLATVIGENDRGNTARLIKAIDRKRFIWIGTGKNCKSLIYKIDVALACLKVLDKKTAQTEIFNITAEPVKMNFIVAEIASVLERKVPKFKISTKVLKTIFNVNSKTVKIGKITNLSATIEKWISEDVFSGGNIAKVYGFRAQTKISEALRRQVADYKKSKEQKNRK